MIDDPKLAGQLIQIAGVSTFLFVLFYYYMKKQFELFERSLSDQSTRSDQMLKATTATFERILEEQRERDKMAHELNREFIETLQHQGGMISRMETKVDMIARKVNP